MRVSFSDAELAFRDEVRAFFRDKLPDDIRRKKAENVALEREDYIRFQKIVFEQGWAAPNWPVEYGGTGWTATQKYIFATELADADAPDVLPFGLGMVGPVISVANPENNVLNPYKLFNAIFQGKDAQTVWQEVGGGFPGGHFYLKNLTYGDGFTQFGLALGCSVALWALIAAAFAYTREKVYLYVILALWVAVMVAVSMIGIMAAH